MAALFEGRTSRYTCLTLPARRSIDLRAMASPIPILLQSAATAIDTDVASTPSDFRNQVSNHPPAPARHDEPFPDPQLEPCEDDSWVRVRKRGLLNCDNLVQLVIFESSELEITQSCSTSWLPSKKISSKVGGFRTRASSR